MLLLLLLRGVCVWPATLLSMLSGNWNDVATRSGSGIPDPSDIVQVWGGFGVYVNAANTVCGSLRVGHGNANDFHVGPSRWPGVLTIRPADQSRMAWK